MKKFLRRTEHGLTAKLRFRRYFKSAYYEIDDLPRVTAPVGVPDWEDSPSPDGTVPGGVDADKIKEHVASLHADGDIGFSREYGEIKRYCEKELSVTSNHCSHPDNKCKNRYLNISACKRSSNQTPLSVRKDS